MVRLESGRPGRGVGKRLRMDLGEGEEEEEQPAKILVTFPGQQAVPRTTRMVEMLLGERANT